MIASLQHLVHPAWALCRSARLTLKGWAKTDGSTAIVSHASMTKNDYERAWNS
jgi:hypothetical protein